MASSGLHSNGYSLVRKICFDILGLTVESHVPELGKVLGEELLTPTRIYTETILTLIRDLPVHGLAHITGGGLPDNLLRIIPKSCGVRLRRGSWDIPAIFPFLQAAGKIEEREMLRTFNNGLGMVAVVPERSSQEILERLRAMDEKAWLVGEVIEATSAAERFQLSDG